MHYYLDKAEKRMVTAHIYRSLIGMNIKPRQCSCESVIFQGDTDLVKNLVWQHIYLKTNFTAGETWLSITQPPTLIRYYIRTLTYQSKLLSFRLATKCEERFSLDHGDITSRTEIRAYVYPIYSVHVLTAMAI